MRERESEGARIVAGHDEHGARRRSGENTDGRNDKMRPYLDSKCLAKGWRLKHGTRWSCWHDRLENGAVMATVALLLGGREGRRARARNGLSTASPHSSPRCGPTDRANADVLPPCGAHGLWSVGHRRLRGRGHQS